MKILGVEIETDFDFNDADDVERFESNAKETGERLEEIRKDSSLTRADSIRESCKAIFNCFDNILGKGVHKKIFGNKCNLAKCIKAYENFIEEIVKQDDEAFKKTQQFIKKYSPNRAARKSGK